ncbi:MAG: hypothetical protein NXI18_18230 [Alphaproteobacteria bacterium]|nr:hypothetical protein [Alphaproteobacteria bacterium]
MEKEAEKPNADNITRSDEELCKRYGIQTIEATYFIVGSYKYTSLEDAVAAAKRREKSTDGL